MHKRSYLVSNDWDIFPLGAVHLFEIKKTPNLKQLTRRKYPNGETSSSSLDKHAKLAQMT